MAEKRDRGLDQIPGVHFQGALKTLQVANQFDPCVHADGRLQALDVVPPVTRNEENVSWRENDLDERENVAILE